MGFSCTSFGTILMTRCLSFYAEFKGNSRNVSKTKKKEIPKIMKARDSSHSCPLTRYSILASIFKAPELTLSRRSIFFWQLFLHVSKSQFRVEMIFISQERKRQMKSSIEAAQRKYQVCGGSRKPY
jgi:hypothetical protein